MERFNFYLDNSTIKNLNELVNLTGLSKSLIVRLAINKYYNLVIKKIKGVNNEKSKK